MKKIFLLLPAMMLMLLPTSIKAQTIALQESFESGSIPATWSQEYVGGEQSWAVEEFADYAYPSGKIPDYKLKTGGGTHRAYLRNTTGQTIGYKTKLVSPAMDLTEVYRPILRFYHAQDKWTADFDTLSVYYRTDPENDWLLLESYTKAYRNWQSETIELPSYNSKTYQIAFEGSDNMGRGIVLDSIVVRSYPECTRPSDITLTGVANGQATISWHASWDADQFHVVLTTKKAEMDTLGLIDPAIIAFDSIMEYDGNFTITAKSLKANTTYYVYLQSICGGQESEWSEPQDFTMAFRESIPYTETFYMPYKSNAVVDQQLESWTWGGSIQPIIDLWIGESNYDIYSRTGDPAVMFNGNYSSSSGRFTTPIAANRLSYMATPELTGEQLKDCQVRMWATMAQRHNRNNANSIIVGVATDVTDFTSFVPMDTITIETKDVIEEYTVSLEKYTGDGKFVAFVSYFDKPNQFYIDEVTIEKRPAERKPDYQTFHIIPDTAGAQISWTVPSAAAQSYNVIVAKKLSFNKSGELQIEGQAFTGSSNTASIYVNGLQAWDKDGYMVAVQAVYAGGKSEWSQPRQFYTSAAMDLPMHFGFEDEEGYYTMGGVASVMYPNNIMMYSTDVEWPHNTAKSSTLAEKEGDKFLYLNMDAGKNSYIVFPMVDSVQATQITFFLNAQTAANKPRCLIELGVMTEPANLNTFVKVDEFRAGEKWTRCYGNFINYKGNGKYIALRWMEPAGQSYSTNYIDDVTIGQLVACPIPTGFDFTVTDTSAVITWNKGLATAWNVKVSTYEFDDTDLGVETAVVGNKFNGRVTEPKVSVSGLDYATRYYVYVQAECDGALTEWTSAYIIRTDCPEFMALPYEQHFNGKREGATGSGNHPACWTWGGGNYQYLYNSSSYHSDGDSCTLYLRTHSATEIGWVAMPAFNVPIQDLMVTYDYYSTSTLNASAVYVGLMSDPDDFETFEVIDSVIPKSTSTWHYNNKAHFINYKGDGKYIAFTCGPLRGNTYVLSYLDNVRVTDVTCQVVDVYASDITSNSMVLHWTGKLDQSSENWQYVVTSSELDDPNELFDPAHPAPAGLIVAQDTTTADSAFIDDLKKQTMYYIYVRPLCGDSAWVDTSTMTECATVPANKRFVIDFESYGKTVPNTISGTASYGNYFKKAQVPECWTVGTYHSTSVGFDTDPNENATTYTLRNYYPYVVSNGSTYTTSDANYYDKGTAATTYHYSNSGYNSLKIYGYYSSTASSNHSPSWAAMPRVEAESDEQFRQLVIKGSFKMATTSSYALIIGVMDDPKDLSTFVVLDSIGPGLGTNVGKDVPFEVSLENYTGIGRYIAFRTPYGKTTTVYLDDIVVDGTNCYEPESSLSRLTDKSVRLTAGLRGQTDWMYFLTDKEAGDDKLTPDGLNPVTKEIVKGSDTITVLTADTTIQVLATGTLPYATKVKVFAGLDASTTYYVAVGAACDPTENLYSQFKHLSFTTLCSAVSSLEEDFESMETGSGKPVPCWIVGSMTSSSTATYIPYINNTASYQTYGTKYLYLYSTTTYQGAYAISPLLDIEDITKKQIMFYAYSSSSAAYAKKLKVGIVTDPLDLSTMVIVDTLDISYTKGGGKYLVSFGDYKGDLDGNYGKHIVFYSEFDATNQIAIGKVELQDIPACHLPTKFSADSITDVSAELSWDGNSQKYRIVVTSEFAADTTLNKGGEIAHLVMDTIVEGNTYKIEGLKPVTMYYAHVAGICGTDTTDFDYAGVSFRTECPVYMPLPYATDFDDMPNGTSQRPFCWIGNYTNATSNSYPYVYNSSSYAHSGAQSVYLYGTADYTTVLVSPEWAVDSLGQMQVTFWARGGASGKKMYIGVVPDSIVALGETDELNNNFIALDSIITTSTYSTHQQYTFNFDEYDQKLLAGTKRFAFKTDQAATSYFYIDDLEVKFIPSCFTPAYLSADNSTLNTIQLHFTPGKATDTKWEVAMWDANATKPDTLYQIVDTVDCVLTGLAASTVYDIMVRTLCANDEKSDWSLPIGASTQYEVDNFTWTFSGAEFATLVEGSTSYYLHPALTPGSNSETDSYLYKAQRYLNQGNSSNPTYVWALDTLYTYGDESKTDGVMRLYTTSTVDTAYVILPKIINADQKQITFDVRAGYAYSMNSTSYSSTYDYRGQMYYSYTPSVLVGTFDEGKGLESFKKLYEVRMPLLGNIYYDPVYPDPNNTTDKHGEYAYPSNNYLFDRVTVPVPDALDGKRMAIVSVFSRSKSNNTSNYACIDNLKVEAKTQAATPQIKSTSVTDTTMTVNWDANGNTAWDILIFDSLAHFSDTLAHHFVKKVENITTTSVTIGGLKEQTSYYIFLAVAGKAELGYVSARQHVHTACSPLAENTVFDFEDGEYTVNTYSSTKYYSPSECWEVGVNTTVFNSSTYSYWPRLMYDTKSYRYSRSDTTAFRFYTSSAVTYQRQYLVMPYMTLTDLDNKELVFYMREAYETLSTHKMSVSNANTYDKALVIGMVEDPKDFFGTFTPIDTVYYSYGPDVLTSSVLATADPKGEKWWDKKIIPLKSGHGNYVAFYKPGYHGGQYIDDISFQVRQTALVPTNLRAKTEARSAQLSWYPKQTGTGFNMQLCADNKFTNLLVDTIVANPTCLVEGLTPNTRYFWRVKQLGTSYGDTEFTNAVDFWTECVPVQGAISTSFEKEGEATENYRNYTSTLLKMQCWTYDNAGTSTTLGTSYPYNIPSTTTVSYALAGDYSLKLYATSTTFSGYVTTPRIEEVNFDTMQVTFWMTPCPHGLPSNTTYKNMVSTAWAAANAAQVEVGTCSDPADLSTYVPIDTVKYSRYTVKELPAKAPSTVANDYTFQKFTLPLAGAVGPYVYMRAVFDKKPNVGQTSNTSSTTIYIDNFAIETLQVCSTPQDMSAEDILDDEATLKWTDGDDKKEYRLQVSKDYQYETVDILVDTVITDNQFKVTGLKPATDYYARLQMTCVENGTGDWSQTTVFRTANAPLYYEQFHEATQLADGWQFATALAKDIFLGTGSFTFQTSIPSSTGGWYSANQNEALSEAHYAGRIYSTSYKWWMISPTIRLNETDTALLSFKMNYVLYNANWSTDKVWRNIWSSPDGGTGYDDQFMVIISDDGGKTWKRENATIWNNEQDDDVTSENYFYGKGDYSLNGIKFLGNNVTDNDLIRIDLSKYQGKAIRVAFYVESTKANTNNVIHIDNVHVNYVNVVTEENTVCQFEDYVSTFKNEDGEAIFTIDGDKTEAGELVETSYKMSIEHGVNDTILALSLNVTEAPQITLPSDTICEGETFSGYEFKPVSKQGLYKKKLVSAVTGCDSIASFYLHVTPRITANAEDTICQGQTYNFNGKMLNRSGLYVDTLTSFVTGCDSIINFVLFVRQPQGATQNIQICHGSTYQFGDTVLATSGLYTRHIMTAAGCDSIATVNLTVLPELTDTIRDYFCPGSTYKQYGFEVSQPGLYRQTSTSMAGCDSLTVLILEHYSTDTTRVEYTITTNDLPYTYETLTYSENTLPGTYVDTLTVKGDGCDAVVIHTLHIEMGDGLDDITGSQLTLAPSVINAGESVSVIGKFSPQQMKGMTVEIYDMTGKRVSTMQPTLQPISISGFHQAGIYNVRITAGDNQTYNGRVMVK